MLLFLTPLCTLVANFCVLLVAKSSALLIAKNSALLITDYKCLLIKAMNGTTGSPGVPVTVYFYNNGLPYVFGLLYVSKKPVSPLIAEIKSAVQ
jgi:hypothetical protein